MLYILIWNCYFIWLNIQPFQINPIKTNSVGFNIKFQVWIVVFYGNNIIFSVFYIDDILLGGGIIVGAESPPEQNGLDNHSQ